MLIDAKKIWISGGYGLHHNFEKSLKYIRNYGAERNIMPVITETILSEVFIELASNETKYMFEDFICPCGCEINKSATALIHEITSRIDNKSDEIEKRIDKELTNNLNIQIQAFMEKDNAEYLEENKLAMMTWSQRNLPTFRRWMRIK